MTTSVEIGPHLRVFDYRAVERLRAALDRLGAAYEVRTHEPARHARHLAALWGVALHEAGRATLLQADDQAILALVPADRKIGAPRLRALLGAQVLRVLRGDRGVGRVGWADLPAPPGALPAVPEAYHARCYVDKLVLAIPRLVIALDVGRSMALSPQAFVQATGATVACFAGTTRLLPEGGMVTEPPSWAVEEVAGRE